jgi:DNA-binding transcriptional regulator YiaG
MSQHPDLKLLPREDRIILAIQAIRSNALLSQQRAAIIYNMSKSTLRTQRAKTTLQRNSYPNLLKL